MISYDDDYEDREQNRKGNTKGLRGGILKADEVLHKVYGSFLNTGSHAYFLSGNILREACKFEINLWKFLFCVV